MVNRISRRDFLKRSALTGATFAAVTLTTSKLLVPTPTQAAQEKSKGKLRLGLVTYNMAKTWDIPTIIKKCRATGFEGVELRTTHAHGVEPNISAEKRKEVKQRFADSGIILWGLGTTCEYHSPDQSVVRRNIETCKSFVKLAVDVGAKGVKVRPNGLPKGVPEEKTLEQIGRALRECGKFAQKNGIEIWVEVHGRGTSHPPRMRKIMDYCQHPQVGVCWNSNMSDVKNGSVKEYFNLLRDYIRSVHINELWREQYPWHELFMLLKNYGYNRFTLAEIPGAVPPGNRDEERLMRYYHALWRELTR